MVKAVIAIILLCLAITWVVIVPMTYGQVIDLKHAASLVRVKSICLLLQNKAHASLLNAGTQSNRKSRIDAVRFWALEYIEALPDFVCTQDDQSFFDMGGGNGKNDQRLSPDCNSLMVEPFAKFVVGHDIIAG